MPKNNELTRIRLNTKSTLSWFLDVGHHFGTMSQHQAQDIARVNRTTFSRWLTGQSSAPAGIMELLRLHAFGEPPSGFSNAWAGFRFHNQKLVTPDERYLTPQDLKAAFFWKQMAFSNERSNNNGHVRPEFYNELHAIYGENYQYSIA